MLYFYKFILLIVFLNFSLKAEYEAVNAFPNLAKKYDIQLIPFLLDGVALKPELNLSDGMHPNEKGVLIISETIKKSLIKILD